MSEKKTPTYTFQRRKKRALKSTGQTKVDLDDYEDEDPYTKYIFWLQVTTLAVLVVGGGYILYKGVPIRVR